MAPYKLTAVFEAL